MAFGHRVLALRAKPCFTVLAVPASPDLRGVATDDEVRCARKCWSIGEPACWELGIEDWICADCKAGAEND